jgi:hypothetical protein
VGDLTKRSVRPFLPDKQTLEKVEWPLERVAIRVLWLLLLLCLFWWTIDRLEPEAERPFESYAERHEKKAEKARLNLQRTYWVIGWLFLLGAIWAINPAPTSWKWLFAAIAVIRLLEIFTSALGTILQQETQIGARSLVTVAIYAAQLALIFAILDHSLAATAFVHGSAYATRASDFLYISWSDLTTIGNNLYTPQDSVARYLELMTTTSGLLLLTVLVAFGIDAVKKDIAN